MDEGDEGEGVDGAPRAAVLWDLDGTLLDSRRSIRTALRHVLREAGLAAFAPDEVAGLIGKPLRDILRLRTRDEAAVERMVARYREVYTGYAWVLARPYVWADGLLGDLAGGGWRHAVVTTKGEGEARTLLGDLGLRDRFDAVVGDDDARALKPDPAPVAEACRRLAVAPERAVMVGDTPMDVAAGRDAGCATVAVTWGSSPAAELAGADAVVADAAALRQALQALDPRRRQG